LSRIQVAGKMLMSLTESAPAIEFEGKAPTITFSGRDGVAA